MVTDLPRFYTNKGIGSRSAWMKMDTHVRYGALFSTHWSRMLERSIFMHPFNIWYSLSRKFISSRTLVTLLLVTVAAVVVLGLVALSLLFVLLSSQRVSRHLWKTLPEKLLDAFSPSSRYFLKKTSCVIPSSIAPIEAQRFSHGDKLKHLTTNCERTVLYIICWILLALWLALSSIWRQTHKYIIDNLFLCYCI